MRAIKLLLLFSAIVMYCGISAQTLNVPARQVTAMSGSQFAYYIWSMSLTDRENAIYAEVLNGNVPDFMRNLVPVTSSATIGHTLYTATYYVIPDYTAIGCDTDYFLCPMTPLLAQRIADQIGCTLPTSKMVDDIWLAASVKLAPSTIPPSPQMTTVPIFYQEDTTIWNQRKVVLATNPLGELVGGDKKDVIISNHIYGNPSPGRVVIYGWTQLDSIPIQEVYWGHENTYADYSHGIRFVQLACTLNGSATTVNDILTSTTLDSVLSNEGTIAVPRYPVALPQAITPTSYCVFREDSASIRVIISSDTTNKYAVQLSHDGLNFDSSLYFNDTNFVITNLLADSIYYVRIAAYNSFDTSAWSEVLGATPSTFHERVLFVNAFDRVITGNTFNFIRQHGKAIYKSGYLFSSATNAAVANGLVNLSAYSIVDYNLGENSTADGTFNATEQTLVSTYLNNGGKLFASGSEIAWTLDDNGTTADKAFYHNYLKAQYLSDSPNSQPSTYYNVTSEASQFFSNLSTFSFDNGTHGTYNVAYPDAITGVNGGIECFYYTSLPTNYAGVCYTGLFPSGTVQGKLVNLGFPFETVYPDSSGDKLMSRIMVYFEPRPDSAITVAGPTAICLGDSVLLQAYDDFGYSYQWFKNGNSLTLANASSLYVNQSGNYTVMVTHNGQSAISLPVSITVNPLPIAFAGNDTTICSGNSIALNATGGTSYAWNNGVVQGVSFSPSSTQTYTVTVTNSNNCSATSNIIVAVNTPAIPVVSMTGHSLFSTFANTYQWYDSTGAMAGDTLQSITPVHNGEYYVVVTDSAGCSAQSLPFDYVATSVTSYTDRDKITYFYDSNAEILYLINPSESSCDVQLRLLDVTGKSLMSRNINLASLQTEAVNLQGFSEGIYIVNLLNEQFVVSGKIMIK
jgi:hypothetical protein